MREEFLDDHVDVERKTIHKHSSVMEAAEILSHPPVISGVLEKLSTSLWATWQARYFELRGSHIVYYSLPQGTDFIASADNMGGVIDLMYIVKTALFPAATGDELVLSSHSREFRFRLPESLVAGLNEKSSMSEWRYHIDEVQRRTANSFGCFRNISSSPVEIIRDDPDLPLSDEMAIVDHTLKLSTSNFQATNLLNAPLIPERFEEEIVINTSEYAELPPALITAFQLIGIQCESKAIALIIQILLLATMLCVGLRQVYFSIRLIILV
jgi:hypothetical protein